MTLAPTCVHTALYLPVNWNTTDVKEYKSTTALVSSQVTEVIPSPNPRFLIYGNLNIIFVVNRQKTSARAYINYFGWKRFQFWISQFWLMLISVQNLTS